MNEICVHRIDSPRVQATYDKLYKEVPTYKLISPSIVSERLKVSLAGIKYRCFFRNDAYYLHYLKP